MLSDRTIPSIPSDLAIKFTDELFNNTRTTLTMTTTRMIYGHHDDVDAKCKLYEP
jgi:hypothetical protein